MTYGDQALPVTCITGGPATVYGQHGPVNIAGLGRHEKRNGCGDFLGRARPSHGHVRQQTLGNLGLLALGP